MQQRQLFLWLRGLTVCVFIGRAWQHLFWDIPLRELLWHEEWMSGLVNWGLGMTWEAYISSMAVDGFMVNFSIGMGLFYLGCTVAAILVNEKRRWLGWILLFGSLGLLFLSGLYWLEKFQSIGQFIEYALQVATPVFLYWALFKNQKQLLFAMKIAVALTFIGHGLYALGFYPVPVLFMQMTIDFFQIGDVAAKTFLQIVGILDLVAAVLLFVPSRILQNIALWYCIIWGTATAFARIVCHFDAQIPIESCHQWLHEVVYRLPHGGVPLILFLMLRATPTLGNLK